MKAEVNGMQLPTEKGIKIMRMHLKLRFCFQIILCLWFGQILNVDVAALIYGTPRSSTSVSDANFIYEFLLGGVEIDKDNNFVLLDKEMASMRQGRAFLAQINDNIPKTLPAVEAMLSTVKGPRQTSNSRIQFDSLVLSMVYSAHLAKTLEREEDRLAWGGILQRLANVTVQELRGNNSSF